MARVCGRRALTSASCISGDNASEALGLHIVTIALVPEDTWTTVCRTAGFGTSIEALEEHEATMGTLDGKVALVTGSGRGIGRAIACKLASEGARLVVNDLDEGPARDTIARINDMGSQAVSCVGDVTAADFGERFVNLAVETFGTPDIIVNNAGYTWDNVIQKMSDEQFRADHRRAP